MKLMKLIFAFMFVIVTTGCATGYAIYNVTDNPTKSYGNIDLTKEEIKGAIILGGENKDWLMAEKSDGHIVATQNYKGLVAVADIYYNEKTFSIKYNDSHGLSYDPSTQLINKRYNRWIKYLERSIQSALKQFSIMKANK